MAGVVQWIDGRANQPGVVEKIFPSIHIKQNQWDDDWNEFFVISLTMSVFSAILLWPNT